MVTLFVMFLLAQLSLPPKLAAGESAVRYNSLSLFRRVGNADELDVFNRVNQERIKYRLRELDWDDEAARLARAYSARMAREHFFDHIDPDGDSVVERAERSRIRNWGMIGENLFMCTAYGGFTRLAVSGWMKSPTHRQNMLDRRWTAAGVGVARDRNGQIYVTQVFLDR
jgi:uncharacterized protein YkwD